MCVCVQQGYSLAEIRQNHRTSSLQKNKTKSYKRMSGDRWPEWTKCIKTLANITARAATQPNTNDPGAFGKKTESKLAFRFFCHCRAGWIERATASAK